MLQIYVVAIVVFCIYLSVLHRYQQWLHMHKMTMTMTMTKITTMNKMTIAHKIRLVIMQVMLTDDKIIHTVKICQISVLFYIMVELTMKASCQVVYQDKGKTIFHANS